MKYLKTCIGNSIKDEVRKEGRIKMPTKQSVSIQIEKEASFDGKKLTMDFERFYSMWLGSQGLPDSITNRSSGEKIWDKLNASPDKRIREVSMSEPLYTDEYQDFTLESVIPSRAPDPEASVILDENAQQLRDLVGIKNTALRSFLLPLITGDNERQLKEKYGVAMLRLAANFPNFKSLPTEDLRWLCSSAGFKLDRLMAISPSEARRVLSGKVFNEKS